MTTTASLHSKNTPKGKQCEQCGGLVTSDSRRSNTKRFCSQLCRNRFHGAKRDRKTARTRDFDRRRRENKRLAQPLPAPGWKNEYELRGDHAALLLSNGGEALLDIDDLPLALSVNGVWHRNATSVRGAYASADIQIGKTRKRVFLHRLILNPPAGLVTDHINHDTFDNRRANLRAVTVSKNNLNQRGPRSDNRSSGILGVHWHEKYGKWTGRLVVDGKVVFCVYRDDKHEAGRLVAEARKEHLGR